MIIKMLLLRKIFSLSIGVKNLIINMKTITSPAIRTKPMHSRPLTGLLQHFLKRSTRIFPAAIMLLLLGMTHPQAAPPHLAGDAQKPAKPNLSQRTQFRFLTGTDFPPFNSLSPEGHLTGYNIDLIRAICQELAIASRCQIEARPWSELLPALQSNEADALIAGLTPDRVKRASLSFSRPYLSLPARFVAAKNVSNNNGASSTTSFSPSGKTVGVLSNTAHEAALKTYFPEAKMQFYKDNALMRQDLKNGKIQLIFGDAMGLSLWLNPAVDEGNAETPPDGSCCHFVGGAYPASEFLGQGMVIAVRKQDSDLRLALNNALNALEHKGVLNDLYLRYFPVDFY